VHGVLKEHEVFAPPGDPDVRLWRYLDLAKFLALLEDRALHFARSDLLGDPWEGAFSQANVQLRPHVYGEHYASIYPAIIQFRQQLRKCVHISCWHMSDVESAAMWSTYADRGLAITSSYRRLVDALDPEVELFVGTVKYVDYKSEWIPEDNSFAPFVHKRRSFEHEHELRALLQHFPSKTMEDGTTCLDFGYEGPPVRAISVDLERLIETVHIAPSAPAWCADLIKAILDRYSLASIPAIHSDLHSDPIF
jgi:hypothetical protein